MNIGIEAYEFNIGDEVITIEGVRGKITDICKCDMCKARGFFEPVWVDEYDEEEFISYFTAKHGFRYYYKIGKYRFNKFERSIVERDIAGAEFNLAKLRKQLQVIDEIESEETQNDT